MPPSSYAQTGVEPLHGPSCMFMKHIYFDKQTGRVVLMMKGLTRIVCNNPQQYSLHMYTTFKADSTL